MAFDIMAECIQLIIDGYFSMSELSLLLAVDLLSEKQSNKFSEQGSTLMYFIHFTSQGSCTEMVQSKLLSARIQTFLFRSSHEISIID